VAESAHAKQKYILAADTADLLDQWKTALLSRRATLAVTASGRERKKMTEKEPSQQTPMPPGVTLGALGDFSLDFGQ